MRGSAVIFSAYWFFNDKSSDACILFKSIILYHGNINNHGFLTGCVRTNIVFLISILTSLISDIAIYTSDKY